MQVEGVNYEIPWKKFRKGASMFFPCLHPARARKQVLVVTRPLGIKILTKVEIRDGIRGLRVWRV
jgi:hypothetical protein